ncbi:hypothetical protein KCP70_21550 [Salmonella enterica subsp. enterica]|nr:hypothetical protein KCP70_21550 [Salmonella enterica subsp. enterica]
MRRYAVKSAVFQWSASSVDLCDTGEVIHITSGAISPNGQKLSRHFAFNRRAIKVSSGRLTSLASAYPAI